MCKRVVCVVCLIFSLSVVSSAGVWSYFDNDSGDQKWSTVSNWKTIDWVSGPVADTLPDYDNPLSDVYLGIEGYPKVTVLIDGTQPVAETAYLTIGFNTAGQLDIVSGGKFIQAGATVNVGGHGAGTSAASGVLNIDGAGSFALGELWNIGLNGGTGEVNVKNGGMLSLGWWGTRIGVTGTGTLNILNGTVIYYGGGLNVGDNGKIIMYPSAQFDLYTDQTSQINGLIAQGKIVTTSERCGLSVVFDVDLNFTHVTVTNCTCTIFQDYDFNYDCYVDFIDLSGFADSWLECTEPTDENCL